MSDSATFSMRVPTDLLARVDHNAAQAGMNRTQYLLSWLPENHEPTNGDTETPSSKQSKPSR